MAISHCYWHLVVRNGNWQICQQIYPQYWHLVVKNGNWQIYPPIKHRCLEYHYTKHYRFFVELYVKVMQSVFDLHSDDWIKLKSGVQQHLFTCALNHSLYIEAKPKIYLKSTPTEEHFGYHFVSINWIFKALIGSTLSCQKLGRSPGRSNPQYWHLVVQNGYFTLLLTSSGQEWQLADLPLDLLADLPPNASWDIYYGMYLAAILDSSRKGGNSLLFLNN